MIPASGVFDQSTMMNLLDHDPVVCDYRAFFSLFNWSLVDQWQERRSPRGRPPHPESAYIKAFLLRIHEGLMYTSHLRRFLLKHPLLVIELGFDLELDPAAPYGFNVEQTLQSRGLAACQAAHPRSRAPARPAGGHRGSLTGRDPRIGRNRRLRCQAHLCVGQREQRAGLRQRALRQNALPCW